MKKKKVIQLEKKIKKTSTRKKEKRVSEFSSSYERNNDSSKDTRDMRFHERSFKLRRMSKNEDSSRAKFN